MTSSRWQAHGNVYLVAESDDYTMEPGLDGVMQVLSVDGDDITVAIVNPDGLNNQVEGAVVQGLGGALFEAVEFANGRLSNGTMAQYRVPRFKDIPTIDVVLLDRKDLPSAGAGETPIVCVAPAIGSAARSSQATNAATSTAPAASAPMISRLSQPTEFPRTRPQTS